MAFRKKVYGQYQSKTCPFCERKATQKNPQGLDVCHLHTKTNLQEIKCLCGSWLEIKTGKFGPFFRCVNCGCLNLKKALEIRQLTKSKTSPAENKSFPPTPTPKKERPKEMIITTNDVEYFS